MPRLLSSLLLLLVACDDARGRLGDASVSLRAGMFTTDSERFGELGALGVLASGGGDCEQYAALDDALAAAEASGGYAGAWQDLMPGDFWELRLLIVTDGEHTTDLTLNPWDAAPTELGQARAELIHYTQTPTDADWSGGDGWAEAWINDGGALTLETTRDGSLRGMLEATFVDGTGRGEDTLRVRIDAEPCDLGAVFEADFRRW